MRCESKIDPCEYEVIQKITNVTVIVRKCKRCGHIDISWEKQADTKEVNVNDEEAS